MKKIALITLFLVISNCSFGQIITTIAGTTAPGYTGDSGLATAAQLHYPGHFAFDCSGNLFFSDNFNCVIRKISTSGIITTIAGTGVAGYSGDGFPAITATLNRPNGLATDDSGNIYVVDGDNNVIRKISTSGIITTVAGTGVAGYNGDGIPATMAQLNWPTGIAFDTAGNLFIADYDNQRVRKVNSLGIISTIAGTGYAGYSGDGYPATSATFNGPGWISFDKKGAMYLIDQKNHAVRKIDTSGIISTFVGNGTMGSGGDGGLATDAQMHYPSEAIFDNEGNLYIADSYNNKIREVNTDGIINTIAGTGVAGYSGNGDSATLADINQPWGIILDACENLYIADVYSNAIRKVSYSSTLSPVSGPTTVALGTTITLTDAVCGTWTSSSPSVATIDSSTGIVTGTSIGTTTITFTGYCGSTTYPVSVIPSTGVTQINTDMSLSIIPNPNNGNFVIKGTTAGNTNNSPVKIEISDVIGNVRYSTYTISANGAINHEINIPNVAPGIYILKAGINGGNQIFRFIVN